MRSKWANLYEHERLFAAMEEAAPDLYAAAVAFLDRFDDGARADTDYVAGLMRKAVEKVRAHTVSDPISNKGQ